MGHANIETTMDIYAEVTDAKKQEAIENLAHKLDVFQERVRLGLTEGTTTCVPYDKSTTNSRVLINETALYRCVGDAEKRLVKGK